MMKKKNRNSKITGRCDGKQNKHIILINLLVIEANDLNDMDHHENIHVSMCVLYCIHFRALNYLRYGEK